MKKISKDFLSTYTESELAGRLDMMLTNYERFPKLIDMAEAKVMLCMKADTEYMRSHNRADLGVRVQTSKISDPTYDEAVTNINIEETVKNADTDSEILNSIEDSVEYRIKLKVIEGMKGNFNLLEKVVDGLEDEDKKLVSEFYIQKKCIRDLSEAYHLSYEAIRYKIKLVKKDIRLEMFESMESTMRAELCS